MARKTSTKAKSKRPKSKKPKPTAVVSRTPIPENVRKEAAPLLQSFWSPTESSYERGREILNAFAGSSTRTISALDNVLFLLSCSLSDRTLPGYATLDADQINVIGRLLSTIRKYADDASQKRPLNFLMLASPGAGKSHFIRCIAAQLGNQKIGAVTYNMVGLQRHEDLIPALDAARNEKVEDKLPLLFLDEFDVAPANYPLLLPLLWDGQLTVGRHELKLGKVIIVLAGSDPHLPVAMEYARNMKVEPPQDNDHPKLIDLLSRINGGVLKIPPLSDPLSATDRRADKICIAVNLLRQRFGRTLKSAPVALLRFIANTEFRYGVRSIAHLIDMIPFVEDATKLTTRMLHLPLQDAKELKKSSLAYHLLNEDMALGVARAWRESAAAKTSVLISSDAIEFYTTRYVGRASSFMQDIILNRLFEEVQRHLSGPA